ncbi:unnamed protein product, partial [Sphagnum tenellum]
MHKPKTLCPPPQTLFVAPVKATWKVEEDHMAQFVGVNCALYAHSPYYLVRFAEMYYGTVKPCPFVLGKAP